MFGESASFIIFQVQTGWVGWTNSPVFWGGWGSHIVVQSGVGQTTTAATTDHKSK